VVEGAAVEELHGDEGPPLFLADVVDGADIGVVQGRGRLGFPAKAGQRLLIAGKFIGKKLQGHEAAQAGIFGFVHDSHSTVAELFGDPIVRNGLVVHVARWLDSEEDVMPTRRLRQ